MCQGKSCSIFWLRNKRKIECKFALISVKEPKTISTSCHRFNHWWWKLGVMSFQRRTSPSPRLKMARQVKSNVKTKLIVCFNTNGLILHEYIARGQRVSRHCPKNWEVAYRPLNSSPWQCPCTHLCQNNWSYGEAPHSVASIPSILIWEKYIQSQGNCSEKDVEVSNSTHLVTNKVHTQACMRTNTHTHVDKTTSKKQEQMMNAINSNKQSSFNLLI